MPALAGDHVPAEAFLEHPRRRLLLTAIEARPGISFRELLKLTGLPAGGLGHHLGMLERGGLVFSTRYGPRRVHFPGPRRDVGAAQCMRARLRGQLLEVYRLVESRPGIRQKDVLDTLTQPRSTSQHQLSRLCRDGLLERRPSGLRGYSYHALEVAA